MVYYVLQTLFGADVFQAPCLQLPQHPAQQTQKSAKIAFGTGILCKNLPYLSAPHDPALPLPLPKSVLGSAFGGLSLSLYLSRFASASAQSWCTCLIQYARRKYCTADMSCHI